MKTFNVYSRFGDKYKAVLIDKNTIHFYASNAHYVSHGTLGTSSHLLSFIDPEGGPLISLFETPAFCINKSLPDREIVEISYDTDHYVFKLEKSQKEKKPAKRKTKIKEQKILKHKKHNRN